MKIKVQTRKLASGCSKHWTKSVTIPTARCSKHSFEVADNVDVV
ncbi:lysyl-tRNA synthetase [Streptococcus pneumoniae]|nr:lysyl-tRNA synthetase [Streptococcus pneumoniae]